MENVILKKKLSTYLTEKGQLRNVSEDLLFEVLASWESWAGSSKDFYKSIGFSHKQMAKLIGKAKKLKREGYSSHENFKEIKVEEEPETLNINCQLIELEWQKGKIIRFPHVKQLVEFMKKAS